MPESDGSEQAAIESPALLAAREARAAQTTLASAGEWPQPVPLLAIADPLPLCIYTTIALLAWIVSPALLCTVFGFTGLYAYARAWRAGLRKSDCVLGDPRLVMLYLALVAAGGLAWTVLRVSAWVGK